MRHLAFALSLAVLLSPGAPRAEGKCGDAPYRHEDKLIVTWVLPVPGDATVEQLPAESCPASLASPEFQKELRKFARGRHAKTQPTDRAAAVAGAPGKRLELPPTDSLVALRDWESQFNVPMDEEAQAAIQSYLDDKYKMYGAVVIHPPLGTEKLRRSYSQCSCTVQRAVVVHDGKTERIYFRSHFLSARRRGREPIAFHPSWCLLVTTATDKLWFPQRFNSLILQDTARVAIDLLTPGPAKLGQLEPPLQARPGKDQTFQGKTWKVQRITGDVPTDRDDPQDISVALTVAAPP